MTKQIPEKTLRQVLDEAPLKAVVGTLPAVDACKQGLCVDRAPVDALRADGTTRLSLVRVYSKHGRQKTLVGQVQVVAASAARKDWALEYYVHGVHVAVPTAVDDRTRWWSAVLERHMQASGLVN